MMTPAVAVSRQDVKDLIEKLLTANIETSVSRQHVCACVAVSNHVVLAVRS